MGGAPPASSDCDSADFATPATLIPAGNMYSNLLTALPTERRQIVLVRASVNTALDLDSLNDLICRAFLRYIYIHNLCESMLKAFF